MTTIDTAAELERALADADIRIDVARFVGLLRECLQSIGRQRADVDPRTQLTAAETAELRKGGLSPTRNREARDRVRVRTATDTVALLATSLTTAEAAKRLGVDPSRIRQLLSERRLLATKDGGEWRLLALQFTDDRMIPNIGAVIESLPAGMPVLAAANWLATPEPDLEIGGRPATPIDWLRSGGDPGRVVELTADL